MKKNDLFKDISDLILDAKIIKNNCAYHIDNSNSLSKNDFIYQSCAIYNHMQMYEDKLNLILDKMDSK